ncbi:Putative glycosyltransferase EpsE [BD1-7 clade bacterium]|uniref:Glycosyltransferase EpsE n=1 Tax=BD1-7 clade bacterium TaxID=2029982 RepID=A0A5S9Q0R1_9GAMM|nr:Putative glycosyltransferase EpsE [BD1-7 clade bacterium]CAA0110403.1 Putative glycosyltransferase EpsE [BD1-7 clade bacterium]
MKFSIITITYNRAHLIEETIQSVLDQTYQNFEMIIVDDGSTDNTKEVIDKYIEEYGDKFRYIPHKHVGMLNILRNIAIENATGEILTILDSDDLLIPTKLKEMHSIFSENPDVNFVFHNLQYFDQKRSLDPPFYNFPGSFHKDALHEILTDKILGYPVYSMRRSIMKEIGGANEEVTEGQNEYYIKASVLYKIYYHDKVLTLMRRHEQNFTSEFDIAHTLDALKTYNSLREKNLLTKKQYTMATNIVNYRVARYHFKNNDNARALENLNDIFKRSSVFDIRYVKSKILKYVPYFRK